MWIRVFKTAGYANVAYNVRRSSGSLFGSVALPNSLVVHGRFSDSAPQTSLAPEVLLRFLFFRDHQRFFHWFHGLCTGGTPPRVPFNPHAETKKCAGKDDYRDCCGFHCSSLFWFRDLPFKVVHLKRLLRE